MGNFELKSGKDKLVFTIMVIAAIYLLNPSWGLFEFIPDNIPLIGNLDEGVATTILLSGLAYFGYDFKNIFRKNKNE